MPFTFKLSRRLARLRALPALIAGATLCACEAASPSVTGIPGGSPVTQLVIVPASPTIDPSQSLQFHAYGRAAAGDSVAVPVSWSASQGTIAPTGLYTADASDADATVTATTTIAPVLTRTITVQKRRVVQVVLTPESTTLPLGGTQQFATYGRRNTGDSIPVTVTFTATGGAVAPTGLYTAGPSAGSFHVIATETRTGLADTTDVSILLPAPPVPVATVDVSPGSAQIAVGEAVQLSAVARDGADSILSGRTMSWTSRNSLIAKVSVAGLVTGVTAGTAYVIATSEGKSDSAAVTVTAPVPPPPPPSGSCLAQVGGLITLSGVQTSYSNTSLAQNTRIDAATARFVNGGNYPIRLGGGANVCFSGGVVIGAFAPSTAWSTLHDTYGVLVKAASGITLENVRLFNYGDGPSFDAAGDASWTIRGVYAKYLRDDCIENDFLNSGTIEDSFFDGCYDGMSSRPYTATADGSGNLVVVRNSLIRLQAMDAVYSGTVPNHNAFWKWHATGPKLALYNTVFRADAPSKEGNGAGMYMAPPPGKLAACENNVMVWLGAGAFPEPLPTTFNGQPCFLVVTGAEGLAYWNEAVARWQAAHPAMLVDVATPIVSLFAPGVSGSATLGGTVTLVATAVDDQAVAGVQFQLDGQSIGAEVTTEASVTKYRLTWDSRSRPNGTYTLTATARDATGKSHTSGGVTITISN